MWQPLRISCVRAYALFRPCGRSFCFPKFLFSIPPRRRACRRGTSLGFPWTPLGLPLGFPWASIVRPYAPQTTYTEFFLPTAPSHLFSLGIPSFIVCLLFYIPSLEKVFRIPKSRPSQPLILSPLAIARTQHRRDCLPLRPLNTAAPTL